jgi:formylglycine-generating enzyme required for sulfatase activity
MHSRLVSFCLPLAAAFFLFTSTASAVTLDWVTVGDPGNEADTTGYGSVADVYQISIYEITNADYIEFLNAVAADDTNGLYNVNMGQYHPSYGDYGGITRSDDPGSYTYTVRTGMDYKPVIFVSFWDALRFANWLHNDQPTGAQDDSTTEDGAYTITTEGIADNDITRNVEAEVFLPSEDEWYKAAYYDGVSGYFDYPASSDAPTACFLPGPTVNAANCNYVIDNPNGDLAERGLYTASASPSGTFDQGGNVSEWNEDIDGTDRVGRGGSWRQAGSLLAATQRYSVLPHNEYNFVGFRVATLPEPGMGLLGMTSILVLAVLRRRRA